MKVYKNLFSLGIILLLLVCCKTLPAIPTGLVTETAMVVSTREEASKIGVEVLKKGGNAFDAMVATEMALVAAYPYCSRPDTLNAYEINS